MKGYKNSRKSDAEFLLLDLNICLKTIFQLDQLLIMQFQKLKNYGNPNAYVYLLTAPFLLANDLCKSFQMLINKIQNLFISS